MKKVKQLWLDAPLVPLTKLNPSAPVPAPKRSKATERKERVFRDISNVVPGVCTRYCVLPIAVGIVCSAIGIVH